MAIVSNTYVPSQPGASQNPGLVVPKPLTPAQPVQAAVAPQNVVNRVPVQAPLNNIEPKPAAENPVNPAVEENPSFEIPPLDSDEVFAGDVPKKSNSVWLYIIPGIVLFIIVIVVIFFFLLNVKGPTPGFTGEANRSFGLGSSIAEGSPGVLGGNDTMVDTVSFDVISSVCTVEKINLEVQVTSGTLRGLLFFVYDTHREYVFSEEREMKPGQANSFELSMVGKDFGLSDSSVVIYALNNEGVSDFSTTVAC